MSGTRNLRRYTPEFRLSAVGMVQAGTPITTVAEDLDIPRRSLANWVTAADQRDQPPLPVADPPTAEALQAEIRRLRAEVAQLREDNELLGKASAYFARHARTGRS